MNETLKTLTDRLVTAQRLGVDLALAQNRAVETFVVQGFENSRKGLDLWLGLVSGAAQKVDAKA